MKEIRTSGPLMFSDPNCPTRVGEIINTISEIYDIPNPSEGMQVYVRDEKKTYTITGLKEAVIGGERVPNAKVDTFEAVKSQVEEIDNNFAEMQEALIDGSIIVGVANLANAVKAGAVTFEMLDGKLRLSASVVDDLETANTLRPLSANQGKILKELIDIINGTGEGSTDKKITDAIAALVDRAPKNLDTLRELAEWIAEHGAEFAAVVADINNVKRDALLTSSVHVSQYAEKINIGGRSLDGADTMSVDIHTATTENAGVMSAEDKEKLDELSSYTYNILVNKKGYYIEEDGEIIRIAGSPHYCVSEFIEVIEGDIFIIENATELASSQSYALYDANKNFVSSSNLANIIVHIPENVRYIVFSRNTTADVADSYKCRRVFDKYLDVLLYLGDKSLYNNYATFINTTGDFIRDLAPQYISTDYIDIVPSQVLFIKGKAEQQAVLYAFYTKDKVLISTGIKEGVLVAPENAYFLAACSDNKVEYYIKALTTEYTDYKLANIESLNTKVGDTNFYKHRANVGHSIGETIPNYILINIPNSQNTICGIQFKIATFKHADFSQKNINVLAYFYPTETTKGLSYASVQVQGDTALDIKYLIKDGSFYIAIPKGTILNSYSGIYVDSLYSWFSAPTISNDSDNIIISEEANIDNYNIVYEYSYTPPKAIDKVTDLEYSCSIISSM